MSAVANIGYGGAGGQVPKLNSHVSN